MHTVEAVVNGERVVLQETAFCATAFDWYCYYLREYTDVFIEGDCNDDIFGGEYV